MQIKLLSVDHIQLVVPKGQLEEAKKFYFGVLGFKELPTPESFKGLFNVFWCDNNGIQVHIGEHLETKRTQAHPAFEIKNLAAVRKYLEAHDVKTSNEPLIPGRDRFTFLDPWDNRIEFLEILNPAS